MSISKIAPKGANIVYKITFHSRIERGEPPYYYIGSKSRAIIEQGKIFCGRKEYKGSSGYPNYSEIVKNESYTAELLYESFGDVLEKELEFQKLCNAKENKEYFNLEYATQNLYNKVGYGLYKHRETGKRIKLKCDDPLVLDGTYVGNTKGYSHTEDTKNRIGRLGKENQFFGRVHSNETKKRIGDKNRGREKTQSEKDFVSVMFKGIPKTDEHKRKIGEKAKGNICVFKPNEKGIRVPISEYEKYKSEGWLNITAYNAKYNPQTYKCPHCDVIGHSLSNMKRWHLDKCKHKSD